MANLTLPDILRGLLSCWCFAGGGLGFPVLTGKLLPATAMLQPGQGAGGGLGFPVLTGKQLSATAMLQPCQGAVAIGASPLSKE